ncbi:hypothetical protein LTR62_000782 [Meristemomyces frigidus]|uniref:Phosphatidate phosphatase APP1 catalytic domain-containing protein n=1 Tax=Meristemomyces frigidus TaxID=1508187 RepID=A0AAN7TGF3_9PEZI|nr:hypothetical protein LTR62_000782 [Meristemomyces frigidus]
MPSRALRALLIPASLSVLVASSPAPLDPARVHPRDAVITPSPAQWNPSKTIKHKRDILSSVEGDIGSVLSGLGSGIPSYVASGVPNFFQGFPTGQAVESSLGLNDADLAALPTNVLNIDPYANYTDQGWQIRFHGNVYKQPNTSNETLTNLANSLFIYGTNLSSLPESQQDQARNLTAEIFIVQQANVSVNTIHIEPAASQGGDGESGGGGAVTPSGATVQDVTLPYNTTAEGDFDAFVPINGAGLQAGNSTSQVQRLNTYVEGATLGNATAYLVPNEGLTIISDIDDILRITKIYEPEQGLLNSFARPFTPWQNMPSIYANWSQSLPNLHFHYLTTTPEQVTRNYMQFIYSTYPGGSFDDRPLNFSDVSATLSVRKYLLDKVFQTFPQRKFILVADTSNSDVMRDYPQMVTDYPGQVQCIFLRNTTATDPGDKFPYDTSGFKGLSQNQYMFFVNADDLTGLDIAGGQCYNQSVAQNLTFSYQGLPGGLGKTPEVNGSANGKGNGSSSSGAGSVGLGGSHWVGGLTAMVLAVLVGGLL